MILNRQITRINKEDLDILLKLEITFDPIKIQLDEIGRRNVIR